MKRLAVLLLAIPLTGEAMLIREGDCPPPLKPFNQEACHACSDTPWKESTPVLFTELRGKKKLLGTSEVKFEYYIGGKDPFKNPVTEEYPITLPVSLYEIGWGHYGCFRLPKSDNIYEEKTYCIPLVFETKEDLNQSLKTPESVSSFSIDHYEWSDNESCFELKEKRYEVTSSEIPKVISVHVNVNIGTTTLKNKSYFDFNLKMSRQRVADGNRKYSDYQCLMLTPDYSIVANKEAITGDLHACFKVAGPKSY